MKQLTLKINSQVMNQLVYRKLKILTLSQMESFTFQGVEEDGEKKKFFRICSKKDWKSLIKYSCK